MIKKNGLYGTCVYVLMIWTIFQEIVLGILYHYVHVKSLIKILFFSKDVLMVLLYLVALFRNKFEKKFFYIQMGYILFVILGLVTSLVTKRVSTMTAISATRGLMLLPAFVTIGYSVKHIDRFIDLLKSRYMKLLVFAAIVGIADYALDIVVGTRSFWTNVVQLGPYMTDIKDRANVLSGGLPGNFYTYSSLGIFTQKRLVSFWAGPLTAGYCLLIPFVYFFYCGIIQKKNRTSRQKNIILDLVIVGIALLMTFTRGIILPTIIFIVLCLLNKYRRDGGKLLLYISALLIIGVGVITVYWDKVFGYIYNGSTAAHIASVVNAIEKVSLWGRGAGTFAASTTEGVWTESAFISIAGQLGIIAVILYIILFLYPIRTILKSVKVSDYFTQCIAFSGLVLFFTGFISGQLNAYTSIAPFFIMLGAAMKYEKRYTKTLRMGEV